jgi:ATPase subunit of ABC transporter with duplicated ATPase domains
VPWGRRYTRERVSQAIVVDDLQFAWPDGEVVFEGLSFVVGPGRTGLIGANGSGKSTLLRLIAGELSPTGGSVRVAGSLGYLPQDLTLDAALPVDQVLGIARTRRALQAIERGEATEDRFAAVGDDWDVEERARATLDRLGLAHLDLGRRVGEVSGGEAVLLGLAARFLRRPDVLLLLDEPTNNLDLGARRRLYDAVTAWPGVMMIVSHDRALLELVDQVADLREGRLGWYVGNLTAYEQAVAVEQEAAQRLVRTAASDVQRQQRELRDARIKLDRRRRYGQKMWDTKREPKIIMGARKRQAEVAAGKHRGMQIEKLEQARERLAEASGAVHDDDEIRVDLPATAVPAGRTVLTLRGVRLRGGARVDLEVRGPERVAPLGPNGAGKTTLLETVVGTLEPLAGTVTAAAPGPTSRWAPCRAANGSGPPRAALLLAEPAPQLLLLDEPTNNLDLASTRQLAQALAAYRGALVVASHDLPFLRTIGITRWLRLAGRLIRIDPP